MISQFITQACTSMCNPHNSLVLVRSYISLNHMSTKESNLYQIKLKYREPDKSNISLPAAIKNTVNNEQINILAKTCNIMQRVISMQSGSTNTTEYLISQNDPFNVCEMKLVTVCRYNP